MAISIEDLAVRMIFDPESLRTCRSATWLVHVVDRGDVPICSSHKIHPSYYLAGFSSIFDAVSRTGSDTMCFSCHRKWQRAEWRMGSILHPRKEEP